ncbi:MAG: right-handed parallel beta-helix repeat-containing protein [Planctomycetota bacterium JB042]
MRPLVPTALLASLVLGSAPLRAATLLVPSQYPTVQAAIDAAANGDTVLVAAGTYLGPGNRDLDPQGKAITIRGAQGSASTILDVSGTASQPHRGFVLTSGGAFLVIDGFTVRNGRHTDGGGILIQGAVTAKFRDLVVEQCVADGVGGGMAVAGGAGPTFEQCVFRFNQAIEGGGVRVGEHCVVSMTGCEITDNGATVRGGGLYVDAYFSPPGATLVSLLGCDIDRNVGADLGAGVVWHGPVSATMTGCRLRDNVTSGGAPRWGGGLVAQFAADVTLDDCEVSGNTAARGGGVFLQQDAVVRLVDCDVLSNHATDTGGGVDMNGQGTPLATTLEMDDCLLEGNTAASFGAGLNVSLPVVANVRTTTFRANVVGPAFPSWGGAVTTGFSCDVTLEDCVLEQNQADVGAGLFVQQDAQVEVRRCTFQGNAAASRGGGIHMNGQGTPFVTNLEVVDSLLFDNKAEDQGGGFSAAGPVTARLERTCLRSNRTGAGAPQFGGGMAVDAADVEVVDCDLRDNLASGGGGAVLRAGATVAIVDSAVASNTSFGDGAGLLVDSGAAVTVVRSSIAGNVAGGAGGGVLAGFGQLTMTNVRLVGNAGPIGGGLRAVGGSAVSLVNVTVAGNSGTFAGGISEGGATVAMAGCVVFGNAPATLQQTGGVTATHSDLESGLAGVGNLSIDPVFVDPGGGDYRLSGGSPCIDAADNGAAPGPFDVERAPRFFDDPGVPDTGVGPAPIADMGAHETYAAGPFHAYGEGCAGTGASPPRLTIFGDPTPGGTITLRVDKARGGSSAFLLLGLGAGSTPIGAGCTLHLFPVLPTAVGPLPLPGTPDAGFGALELPVPLPPTASSASVTVQAFVGDPGSALGFTVSNGFRLGIL